ncbi:hypothetical protein GLAREA_01339 [Glarea lozoyensis ATCC 20868]|uniref:Uncharacterized protein n=1 Tax=Glarea lozoyensis (strain ATCC 20868 / MF5171) TaxID=1116229 RepID=S3CFY2_GLAL2|nr:uncharacterized protein GLAREA_01339 [Glarea lozoyensis ATCC 20868]EPE25427.1 hypothetical protein GLAREA_01339 [Glarea lozoyensis ATCC 20868]
MEQQINNPQTQLSLGPMECPDRYTIATSSVINTDTTFYQCCPSSFGLSPISQTRFGNPRVSISLQPDCSSLLTPLQVFSYSEFLRDGGTVTTRVITTTATNGGALVAYPIKGYKFASLAATTIGSTSSNNGAPTLASFSSVAIATQSSPAGTQNAKPLSTAAAIGIGCVAVTAVVLLISIIAFCLLKRRKRKASVISAEKVAEPIEGLNGDINLEQACGPNAHELGQSKQLSEMHSEREIRELSSQTPPLELESGAEEGNGTVTEWLPLTSAYSAPPECAPQFTSLSNSISAAPDFFPWVGSAFELSLTEYDGRQIKCLPDAATQWRYQMGAGVGHSSRLSLGPMECPILYTTAASISLNSETTFYQCCPSSYSIMKMNQIEDVGDDVWSTNSNRACTSLLSSAQVVSYLEMRPRLSSQQMVTTTVGSGARVVASPLNGYKFATRGEDPSLMATVTMMVTPTSAIQPGTTATSNQPPVTGVANEASSTRLPTTSTRGVSLITLVIIVFAIVGLFAIFGVVAFCFLRRRKRKRADIAARINNFEMIENQYGPVEIDDTWTPKLPGRFKEKLLAGNMSAEDEVRDCLVRPSR